MGFLSCWNLFFRDFDGRYDSEQTFFHRSRELGIVDSDRTVIHPSVKDFLELVRSSKLREFYVRRVMPQRKRFEDLHFIVPVLICCPSLNWLSMLLLSFTCSVIPFLSISTLRLALVRVLGPPS